MFFDLLALPEGASFFAQISNGSINPARTSFLFWIIAILGLLISISIHEWAHAYTAYKLGDSTAKLNDRMNINPAKHFDLLGLGLILFTRFGYGKPVPVNPNNFKNPAQGIMLVSIAGPLSNVFIAVVLGIMFLVLRYIPVSESFHTTLIYSLPYLGLLNIGLAIFNLLPIAPLDGSKIWGYFHHKVSDVIYSIQPYGFLILLAMIYPAFGNYSILGLIMKPIILAYSKIFGFSGISF